jgi:hypothetical protein
MKAINRKLYASVAAAFGLTLASVAMAHGDATNPNPAYVVNSSGQNSDEASSSSSTTTTTTTTAPHHMRHSTRDKCDGVQGDLYTKCRIYSPNPRSN